MTIESEKTPLIRIDALCEQFRLSNLLVKDESQNPFGTWKDRRSELIVKTAVRESVDTLVLITSGNAGFSLAKFAQTAPLKIVAAVDVNLTPPIKQALHALCEEVIELNLSNKRFTSEELIRLARKNEREVIWDVTNGFHAAYRSLIEEAQHAHPDYIICPLGSGEGFVGLFEGLKQARLKTTLIGITSESTPSFADKLHASWTPYEAKLRSIEESGHRIIKLSEDEIHSAFACAKEYMDCEPSGAVVIGALKKFRFETGDKIVLINSGKGLASPSHTRH